MALGSIQAGKTESRGPKKNEKAKIHKKSIVLF